MRRSQWNGQIASGWRSQAWKLVPGPGWSHVEREKEPQSLGLGSRRACRQDLSPELNLGLPEGT